MVSNYHRRSWVRIPPPGGEGFPFCGLLFLLFGVSVTSRLFSLVCECLASFFCLLMVVVGSSRFPQFVQCWPPEGANWQICYFLFSKLVYSVCDTIYRTARGIRTSRKITKISIVCDQGAAPLKTKNRSNNTKKSKF